MKKFIITLFSILFLSTSTHAQDINVAFTIDNNYPIFTLLAINTILQNNVSNSHYKFYIIENNVTAKNKEKMTKYVHQRNQDIEFINIDTKIIDDGANFFKLSGRITRIALIRILLPDLLPEDVHKVIYLDGDICVNEDLKNLYDIDLENYPAGLASNITFVQLISKKKLNFEYYNSGVILMDLDMWRKEKISKEMIDFIDKYMPLFLNGEIYLYPDQDLINIVLNGRIKKLPQKWNNQTIRRIVLDDIYDGGIVHFIGDKKPWNYPARADETFKIYYKYWNTSGLKMYKYYYGILGLKNIYLDIYQYKLKRFYKFKTWLFEKLAIKSLTTSK